MVVLPGIVTLCCLMAVAVHGVTSEAENDALVNLEDHSHQEGEYWRRRLIDWR